LLSASLVKKLTTQRKYSPSPWRVRMPENPPFHNCLRFFHYKSTAVEISYSQHNFVRKNLKNVLSPGIRNIWYSLFWFKFTRLVSAAIQTLSTCTEFIEQEPGCFQRYCGPYDFGYKFILNSFNPYEQDI
jgi:hypothetical protein